MHERIWFCVILVLFPMLYTALLHGYVELMHAMVPIRGVPEKLALA